MKTIPVSSNSADVLALLEQARVEGLLLKAPDGAEFVLSQVEDFDEEVYLTQRNGALMQLLEQRQASRNWVPLEEVQRRLDK